MNPLVSHSLSLTGKLFAVNLILGFIGFAWAGLYSGIIGVLVVAALAMFISIYLVLTEVTLLTKKQIAAKR